MPHRIAALSIVVLWALAGLLSQAAHAQTTLAANGQAAMPIVLGEHRSDRLVQNPELRGYGQFDTAEVTSAKRVENAAKALAEYLGRITGAGFELAQGDGTVGIAVGLFSDFPELGLADQFDPRDVLRTEEYLIRSHDSGLYLIGATELAVEHAVWDLLDRLGYRQFFPGSTWEYVPSRPELSVAIDTFQSPDYHSRLIWYGAGMLPGTESDYQQWAARNRAVAGFRLNTSHEYNRIRSRHREAFADNPDFYAMVDGKREAKGHAKFNVTHPQLRQLVIDDAIQWFKDNPYEVSKSMDPSDFGFWDESEEAAAIGSPTDQALLLANLVAQAANEHFDTNKYVGMYAYYAHQSPPTNQTVDPHVIVSFATRFLRSRQSVDELIAGWREKGLQYVGIRAYGSVFGWDWNLPSRSFQGGSLDYLTYKIPHYHSLGARFYTSESNNSWGPIGLGHYVTARMLWDVQQAEQVDALVDDFLDKMFGSAREPMARFYARIAGSERALARDNIVHYLYACLHDAYQLTSDRAVAARLDDLTQYVRYIELFADYDAAQGDQRQANFEALMRHAYRMRLTHMIHIMPLYARESLSRSDPQVEIPAQAKWNVPEGQNLWKSSDPFTAGELQAFIAQGLSRHADRYLQHSDYTAHQPDVRLDRPVPSLRVRQSVTFLLHAQQNEAVEVNADSQLLDMSVGPVFVVLSPAGEPIVKGQVEARGSQTIRFVAPQTGTYRISFDNNPNTLRLSSANPLGILLHDHLGQLGRLHLKRPVGRVYFLVPAGVEQFVVRVAGERAGERVNARLYDPAGQIVEQAEDITGDEPKDFVVTRSAAASTEVWSFELQQPTTGYFGDVFVTLDAKLPPVLSMSPDTVFTTVSGSNPQ